MTSELTGTYRTDPGAMAFKPLRSDRGKALATGAGKKTAKALSRPLRWASKGMAKGVGAAARKGGEGIKESKMAQRAASSRVGRGVAKVGRGAAKLGKKIGRGATE